MSYLRQRRNYDRVASPKAMKLSLPALRTEWRLARIGWAVLTALGMAILLVPAPAQRGARFLEESPRPELNSRDRAAIYLQDHLRPDQRVIVAMAMDSALYRTSRADLAVGQINAGMAAEVLAFTEHGLLVRVPDGLNGNLVLGWVGKAAVDGPGEDFFQALGQLEQRRAVVAELIEDHEVAIGMTPGEVRASLGQPTEERVRETVDGVSGTMAWVEVRRIPLVETFRDPYTGQLVRRIVGYQTIEEGRTEVEFANGAAQAIERSRDRRRSRELPTVPLPVVIPGW